MKNLRIVFMGTPEFAVATLGSLLMNEYNVVGVVTAPDKPSGRGRLLAKSAVKEYAEENKILPLMQPTNLKSPEFITELKSLNADLFIVVAFRMLPTDVWKIPPLGTINLHASLLPQYRGAAPINHAIINGESITGVTTFLIDEKIDTGKILLRKEVHISPLENAGDLQNRLKTEGAKLVIKTISDLVKNKVQPIPQEGPSVENNSLKLAPKIFPSDCVINWNNDVIKINNFIRGLAPDPCAKAWFQKDKSKISFKIYESNPEIIHHNDTPGSLKSDGKSFLMVSCIDGFINITSLQLEGKKRMTVGEFLRGFKISNYTIFIN